MSAVAAIDADEFLPDAVSGLDQDNIDLRPWQTPTLERSARNLVRIWNAFKGRNFNSIEYLFQLNCPLGRNCVSEYRGMSDKSRTLIALPAVESTLNLFPSFFGC
jgi:hypothetical protein